MSLIKCCECGKEISDLAHNCPNCGAPIEPPIDDHNSIESAESRTKFQKNRKKLLAVGIPILVILIGIGLFFGVKAHNKKVAENNLKACKTELEKYSYDALCLAADCEKACNLTNSVWSNAIYKKDDKKTNEYTKNKSGNFYGDFNDALKSLYNSDRYTKLIDKIDAAKESLTKKYKKIKGYQEKLNEEGKDKMADSMTALKELNEQIEIFSSLATNPNGSLNSYGPAVTKVDQEFMTKYSTLKNSL